MTFDLRGVFAVTVFDIVRGCTDKVCREFDLHNISPLPERTGLNLVHNLCNIIIIHKLCKVNTKYTIRVKILIMKERLKELRKNNKYTQKELSRKLGITLSAYSNYEQGIREPSLQIIIKLVRIYGVSADYILGLENEDGTKKYEEGEKDGNI